MFVFDYISIALAGFSVLWASYIFFIKYKSKEARYLAYLIIIYGLWVFLISITNLSQNKEQVALFTQICVIAGLLTFLFVLFFVTVFRFSENQIIKKNKIILGCSLLFIILVIVIPGDILVTNIEIYENKPPKGSLNIIFSYYFILLLLAILIKSGLALFNNYKDLKNQKKNQIKYFLLGAAIPAIAGLLFDAVLPWLFKDERFYSIGPIFFVFFVGFTSYAIIKHKLLDIRIIIQRGIIYSLLLSTIVGIYLVLIFVLGFIFQQVPTELSILVSAGITTILGIYTVPIIERYFIKITNKIFYKDKYDYPQAVYEISEILNKNIGFKKLLMDLSDRIKSILKVESIRFIFPGRKLIFDEAGRLRKIKEEFPPFFIDSLEKLDNIVLVHADIPDLIRKAKKEKKEEDYINFLKLTEKYGQEHQIRVSTAVLLKNKLIGLILLGEKLSGDIYTEEDIALLKTLSYQAAVAIEKARLYEEVREYSEELEKKVVERTAKIQGIQKEQKQMMQEISHGLQTPLTILKGELSSLKKQFRNSGKILSLEKSIDRVSKFVYDMMRLASLEAKEGNFKKEKLNLSLLLEELVESFEIITQDKNIKIKHNIEPDIHVRGNKSELEEMVMNLVSNSIKYMGDGQRREIAISLRRKNKKIELAVADTGIGISQEDLPNIFTRFYRVKDALHSGKKGTGLGLAICRKIVEKHGGKIFADSKAGEGSLFKVEI